MGEKPTSRTEKGFFIEDNLFNLPGHYKTTITNGEKTVVARGDTPEESQKRASEEWEKQ